MWRYALHLTGHFAAAILAGIVFAFVPFRFDHYHHLELQATIFLPLTLLYFERAIGSGSRRDAWLMMAAFVAQVYSCIYYSVFLATALVPIAGVAPVAEQRRQRACAFLRAICAGRRSCALVAVSPYAVAYCAESSKPRRAARSRRPAVLGDAVELPRDARRRT